MNVDMNRIIWAICSLTTLLLPKTCAKPLFSTRTGRHRTQMFTDVRFTDYKDDGLFDPSDEATKCSKGSTFCEGIDTYPTSELTSILKEENKYAELFGTDLVNPITIGNRFGGEDNENPITIGNRFGDEENEEQLCASQVRVVYPQVGLTQDNTWEIHSEPYHRRQCNMLQNFPIGGYRAQCKQKYVYRQLVTIDEEGNTMKIPSCCQCVLVRTQTYGQWKRGF